LAFDAELLQFTYQSPAFAPLLQLPPTLGLIEISDFPSCYLLLAALVPQPAA
jgi:hypothetical protein